MARFKQPLPAITRVAKDGSYDIKIVALGSSSTAGSGASNPNASYPARLDAELDRLFPGRDFHVANFGTGGQLASDMLERIDRDIIPLLPSLVIWQTGVNDAIQDVGLENFRNTLRTGIAHLKSAGIDVILVDMQYYPRSERVAVYKDYLRAMRDVAEDLKVALFRRHTIMHHLIVSGQYTSAELLAPDNFHLNDLSYGCLAKLIAEAITDQIRAGRRSQSTLLPNDPY
ncbi:MAG TPA: GDSL-type esterase/lipase family protein [Hyphomicrobiaceae bacterium]|nr:GDSL-type esterase/lipase family protein [Hyphomicrobiaceae bacterium]